MEFREQLMELRKQRGWSQEQLGAKDRCDEADRIKMGDG